MEQSDGHNQMMQHIRSYLQSSGYYTKSNMENTKQLFLRHAQYYLQGIIRHEFFSNLADELLYTHLVRQKDQLEPDLFHALLCASSLSSTTTLQQRKKHHKTLQRYMQTL